MDNAARFGFISDEQIAEYADKKYKGDIKQARKDWQVKILANKNANGDLLGFSINQESIELNAYLAQEKLLLAKMGTLLGLTELSRSYKIDAKKLSMRINQCFYDENTKFYYDLAISSETKSLEGKCEGKLLISRGRGPEGWSPLWTNIATKKQAKQVKESVMSTSEFNSFVPLPTASLSNPAYDENIYWRGRVWLDRLYFGISGLNNYGYRQEAKLLTQKLLDNAQGLIGDASIRENYNPVTGQVQGATNFSWSAAHLLMLLNE